MKRHPALEPFSRDHNDGLILARRLSLAAQEGEESRAATADLFTESWKREMKDHFDEEERLLKALASEGLYARLVREHREIEDHADALEAGDLTPYRLESLARVLHDHIRWEERQLFVEIEASATPEQLENLATETQTVEERRWPNNPRREELVRKRQGGN
jgi:hypothetical protein